VRIVSLVASATEIVHALGLGDHQVGRSHECDFPPGVESLPQCTRPRFAVDGSSAEIDRLVKVALRDAASVYEVFDDVLERLRPTHILTQSLCRVCAVSTSDVERDLSERFTAKPSVVALEPESLDDVWADVRRVASACGVPEAGEALVARLTDRMRDVALGMSGAHRPTVALIEWQEPLMAAGNWAPELIATAGGASLFGESGRRSPWLDWKDLVDADPEVIVVSPCGFALDRAWSEMYWLARRPEWESLRAVRDGRVYVADGNAYFHRPGPRLVETAEMLASMLHPGRVAAVGEGAAWRRWSAAD
jgi:iron complex transport system substrate-binding protein